MESKSALDILSAPTAAHAYRDGNLGVAADIGLAVVIAHRAAGPAGSQAARTLCAIQSWYAEQLDDARVDKILSDRIRLDYPEKSHHGPDGRG